MEKDVQKLINAGQTEDTVIIHAAPGEMVVPPVISNQTQQMINQDMQSVGLNPAEYMVGQGSINNLTGLQEFGFLSKLFKKVKKVVKKVAPIAVSFIPGIGPVAKGALTAVAGKASGLSTKEALLGGLTAGVGAKIAAGRAAAAGTAGAASKVAGEAAKKGIFGGTLGPRIRSGLGNFFKPGEDATGIFGGKLGPNIRSGIGNVFSGGLGGGQQEVMMPEEGFMTVSGGQQEYPADELVAGLVQDGTLRYEQGYDGMPSYLTDGKNKFYSGEEVMSAYSTQQSQPSGLSSFFTRDPKDKGSTPQIIKTIGDYLGFGGRSGTRDVYGDETPTGSFFGRKTPDAIKGIEDVVQGVTGGNAGLAGLAALYGLATKKAAEKTEGGLRDIRLSTRPDLMPQQTFQGFDVGVRPGMSYGGGMEYRPGFAMGTPDGLMKEMIGDLDLRPGGPSVGPGTETSDDIPAMLSDGEFVMTAAANKGLGGFKIEKNKDSITLYPTGKPDREQGFKNNDMMMKMFEDYQEMVS